MAFRIVEFLAFGPSSKFLPKENVFYAYIGGCCAEWLQSEMRGML
jgi:hypothetical protein